MARSVKWSFKTVPLWVGTEFVAPYTINWKNVPARTYTITAKAYDSKGVTTTSAPRAVTVQQHVDHPPLPFAYSKVVFYKDQMQYNPTNEFLFPCVIKTDHIANPFGKYYLYLLFDQNIPLNNNPAFNKSFAALFHCYINIKKLAGYN